MPKKDPKDMSPEELRQLYREDTYFFKMRNKARALMYSKTSHLLRGEEATENLNLAYPVVSYKRNR